MKNFLILVYSTKYGVYDNNDCLNNIKIKSVPFISSYNINIKKIKVRKTIIENIKKNVTNNLVVGSGHSLGYNDKNIPKFISTDQDELDLVN